MAFDLPTQTGYDSDHPLSRGEVGKVGVPICHIEDMQTLFEGIPLDRMNTSMTINATAAWLLALVSLVCIAVFDMPGDRGVADPVAIVRDPVTLLALGAPRRERVETDAIDSPGSAANGAVLHAYAASPRVP